MRYTRTSMVAILWVVAILSLTVHGRAIAQKQHTRLEPSVRIEAIDRLIAEVTHIGPIRGRAGPPPIHTVFVDETTPWILPPDSPPETIETTGVLQCVPYARFMSGIGIRGDAWTWWDKAAGSYARGDNPEPGAVLSFPGIERMPLGHVAVVTHVLSARRILVDHANWPNAYVRHGAISRDVEVADVSPANDWSEVRVQFGEGGPLGSVYPANGFIYEWNEAGVRIAQPRFSLDYALWSPRGASWRPFNAISYLWVLPPLERKKAYAAAGVVPGPASPIRGASRLVLGPIGPTLTTSALGRPLGVNRLDVGMGGRARFGLNRFVMQ